MKPRRIQIVERQHEGQIGDDHAAQLVHLVRLESRRKIGMISAFSGDHLHGDDQDDEGPPPVEAELRESERGQERQHERQRDDHADDDQAVLDVGPEVRPVDRVREIRQRGWSREPLGGSEKMSWPRLEPRRDHPVDREDHHEEDECPTRLTTARRAKRLAEPPRTSRPRARGRAGRATGSRRSSASPIFTICRM